MKQVKIFEEDKINSLRKQDDSLLWEYIFKVINYHLPLSRQLILHGNTIFLKGMVEGASRKSLYSRNDTVCRIYKNSSISNPLDEFSGFFMELSIPTFVRGFYENYTSLKTTLLFDKQDTFTPKGIKKVIKSLEHYISLRETTEKTKSLILEKLKEKDASRITAALSQGLYGNYREFEIEYCSHKNPRNNLRVNAWPSYENHYMTYVRLSTEGILLLNDMHYEKYYDFFKAITEYHTNNIATRIQLNNDIFNDMVIIASEHGTVTPLYKKLNFL